MTYPTKTSILLDFVGGFDRLTVNDFATLLESDGVIDEALEELSTASHWVDQNRLVEHGPRGYRQARVIDADAFDAQLARYQEDLKNAARTVSMEVAVTVTAVVEVPAAMVPEHLSHRLHSWPENLLNACRNGWALEAGVDPAVYDAGEAEISRQN